MLDEDCRGELWNAIGDHNRTAYPTIEATRVGEESDLPLGSTDAHIPIWAAAQNRVVVSFDKATMPGHLLNHRLAGHHSPGLFFIRAGARLADVLSYLEYAGEEGDPAEFANVWVWIP